MFTKQSYESAIQQELDILQRLINSGKVQYHHSSSRRGYWPAKMHNHVERYSGRFGKGFIVHSSSVRTSVNCHYTNRYHLVDFYIYSNEPQLTFDDVL